MRATLEAFFQSVADAFAFLEEYGASSVQSLDASDGTELRAIRGADLTDDLFVFARVAYHTAAWCVRVDYDDREYLINTLIELPVGKVRPRSEYSLWEWIDALGGDNAGASHSGGADTADRVAAGVRAMGESLRTYLPDILRDAPSLLPRVQANRDRRMQQWREQEQRDRERRIAFEAAAAFRDSHFQRVVELLTPLEPRLAASDRKKLDYARKRVGAAGQPPRS